MMKLMTFINVFLPLTTVTPSTGRQYTLIEKGVFSYEVMSLGVLGVVAVTMAGLA
jgi:hypothetical protein